MRDRARALAARSLAGLRRLVRAPRPRTVEAPVSDPPAPAPLRLAARRLTDRELLERVDAELESLIERLVVIQWDVDELSSRRQRQAVTQEPVH